MTNITPARLRGMVSSKFRQYLLMHHHLDKDKLLYRYPLIQYKKINNEYHIIGLAAGAEILKNIWADIKELNVNGKNIPVMEKELKYQTAEFGVSPEKIKYRFFTPWIALNQKNYEDYKLMTFKERKNKLQKVIIGNTLSLCKTLNYTVLENLTSELNVRTVKAILKGILMNAFMGTFTINFLYPDYIGIGKSVSRGFGTIKRND